MIRPNIPKVVKAELKSPCRPSHDSNLPPEELLSELDELSKVVFAVAVVVAVVVVPPDESPAALVASDSAG